MGSPDYAPLPRESLESDRYLSPTASERPSLSCSPHTSKIHSITINYVLILRLISLAFTIPSFVIFVQRGSNKYIAADIFLMLMMIFNAVRILHLFVSSVFHITVEISRGSWQSRLSVRPNGARATNIMDCFLASGLGFAMVGGMVNNWRNYRVVDGIVLAFFTMAIQYIIALPINNQTFMLKFHYHSESGENWEALSHHFENFNHKIHQAFPREGPHRQTPEDLV